MISLEGASQGKYRHRPLLTRQLLWAGVVWIVVCLSDSGALAQQAGAAGVAAGKAVGGFYISPLWLPFLILCLAFWFYLASWVCDDAAGNGLRFRRWTSIMLGAGGLGALCMVLVHPALGFLLLAGEGGAFALYIRERNEVVPEKFSLFSRAHAERVVEKLSASRERKSEETERFSVELLNRAEKSLAEYVSGQGELSEAAEVLGDIIGRASLTQPASARMEPVPEGYAVRFLMDGVMQTPQVLSPEIGQAALALVARFSQLEGKDKSAGWMMARLPGSETIEVGVRGVKTPRGPAIVLDMPDWTKDIYKGGPAALGMHKAMIEKLKTALEKQGKAILFSGPEGSGRTTTLEAATGEIDIFTTDVVILREHVAHELDQVVQREVDLDSDEQLRSVLEAVLRDEPHVIGVDELSAPHVAKALFQFAGAGGRLLAVQEADSAGQAVQRLLLGVDAELVSRTLALVLNQRLLRKLCPHCKEPVEPPAGLLAKLKIDPAQAGKWCRPVGCERCLNVGYLGRTAVFEMLLVNEAVRKQIADCRVTRESVRTAAGKQGIRTLREDGLLKVRQGITTLSELRRVLK